jgi:hypothetical protein
VGSISIPVAVRVPEARETQVMAIAKVVNPAVQVQWVGAGREV